MKRKTVLAALALACIAAIGVIVLMSRGPSASTGGAGHTGHPAPGTAQSGHDSGPEGLMVEIPQDRQQMIGVKTVEAAIVPLSKTIRTVGRVQFDERRLTTVNTKVEGWIEKLHANYSGQYVVKGSPLAEIYSPELYASALELSNLMVWKKEKSHRFQRNIEIKWGDRYGTTGQMLTFDLESILQVARQRLKLWELSDEEIKNIESGEEPPRTFTLKSPASGFVFQKPGFKGTRVSPGDKLFDIVDLSSVWIIADIYEHELPLVKTGLNGRITSGSMPGEEMVSKLDFIYPALSAQTRTAKARFTIPNKKNMLKPQMFVNVEIPVSLGDRLAIPESAVIDSGTRQLVYVDKGDGYFEARQVSLGVRADRMVEVLKGLKPGERVASAATFLIDSEARLRGIVQ